MQLSFLCHCITEPSVIITWWSLLVVVLDVDPTDRKFVRSGSRPCRSCWARGSRYSGTGRRGSVGSVTTNLMTAGSSVALDTQTETFSRGKISRGWFCALVSSYFPHTHLSTVVTVTDHPLCAPSTPYSTGRKVGSVIICVL